jgi:DUF971 family protein/molybdopterin converting factor small subunit
MTDKTEHPTPTEINLHSKSRMLVIAFSDGKRFEYPCEYLRIYSRAAEIKLLSKPETGKEEVNILQIEPQGNYAIRVLFDDGHNTGIYSWETLYDLGINREKYWQAYLDKLKAIGYERGSRHAAESRKGQITLMYFAYLAKYLRRESEKLDLPESVTTVETLLAWLRKVKRENGYLLADDNVTVTVNKQFTEPFTRIDINDEIGIVPVSPTPPPPPRD